MSISAQNLELAKRVIQFADERDLNPFFERAYEKATGFNPVRLLILWWHTRTQALWDAGFGSASLFFYFLALIAIAEGRNETQVEIQVFSAATLIAAMAVMFFVFALLNWVRCSRHLTRVPNFLSDINNYIGWGPGYTSSDRSFLCGMNEEQHRALAEKILVSKAKELLRIQAEEMYDEAYNTNINEQALLMSALSERYDVLARLGLASGGYKNYFKQAKIELKTEKAISKASVPRDAALM